MATFQERRQLFAHQQRRFIAVIGSCLIAAATIVALGAGARLRHEPFPLGVALMLGVFAAALMPIDRDRPAAKLALFGLLCACVWIVLVLL